MAVFDGIPDHAEALACGTFRLDPARRRLVDSRGAAVPLRAKSFGVLHALLLRPGRVVSRAELLDAVWGDLHVTDDSVTQCVVEIRRALGDGAGIVLRTLRGHGYLLEADPTAAALPASRVAVAVLPFAATGDVSARAVGEALCRDLLVELAGDARLRVLDGQPAGAEAVLDGGVCQLGAQLRITAKLVQARSGLLLWAERFDREAGRGSPLALQDEIAGAIGAAVRRSVIQRSA